MHRLKNKKKSLNSFLLSKSETISSYKNPKHKKQTKFRLFIFFVEIFDVQGISRRKKQASVSNKIKI